MSRHSLLISAYLLAGICPFGAYGCEDEAPPPPAPPAPGDASDAAADVGSTDTGPSADIGAPGDSGEDAGTTQDGGVDPPVAPCMSAERILLRELWGPVVSKCAGCHNAYGLAKEFGVWTLELDASPESVQANVATLRSLSFSVEPDGDPYLVLKPSLQLPAEYALPGETLVHAGGLVLEPESEDFQRLRDFAVGLAEDSLPTCEDPPRDLFADVIMLDPAETLHRAHLVLAGSVPQLGELEDFEANGADLSGAVDELMSRPAFIDRIKAAYADRLLTNGLLGIRGQSIVPTARLRRQEFPDRFYFYDCNAPGANGAFCCQSGRGLDESTRCCWGEAAGNSPGFCETGAEGVATFLSREPLELIGHIVEQRRSFKEVLTASYTMVNPYTAKVYGVEGLQFTDPEDPEEYVEAQLVTADSLPPGVSPEVPHAGVVSSHIFMNRYRTTPTNLNRHRTRTVFDMFLGINLAGLAEFVVDQEEDLPLNPTLDAASCRVCHAAMDPVAGAFRDWDFVGRWRPRRWDVCEEQAEDPEPWHEPSYCVRPTGYQEQRLPDAAAGSALAWMLEQIADDERFALRTVQTLFESLTGLEVLDAPPLREAADYAARVWAYEAQQRFFEQAVESFVASDYRLREIVRSIVLGPYFRAWNMPPELPEAQKQALLISQVGLTRLLTPELLHRRIEAVTGIPWRENESAGGFDLLLTGTRFRVLYGGIDSLAIVHRMREPFAVQANIARRMANSMACRSVPQDFSYTDRSERHLFPEVEVDMQPEDEAGDATHTQAIRENIRHLHYRLLGERVEADDVAVQESYDLFVTVWREGVARIAAGTEGGSWNASILPPRCRAPRDFFSDVSLDEQEGREAVVRDESYVVRAWIAVVSALLSDIRFLAQ